MPHSAATSGRLRSRLLRGLTACPCRTQVWALCLGMLSPEDLSAWYRVNWHSQTGLVGMPACWRGCADEQDRLSCKRIGDPLTSPAQLHAASLVVRMGCQSSTRTRPPQVLLQPRVSSPSYRTPVRLAGLVGGALTLLPCVCHGRVCLQAGSPAERPQMPAPWQPGSLSCPAAPRGPCQPAAGSPHGSPCLRQLRQAQPLRVQQTCSQAWQAAAPCWPNGCRSASLRASTRGSHTSSSSTRAMSQPTLVLLLQQRPGARQALCQLGSHRQPCCRWRMQGSDCRPLCRQHQ